MTINIPYTLTNESINIVWKGKTYTITKSAPNFRSLRKAILKEDWDSIPKFLTVNKTVEDWSKKRFKVDEENNISYEGTDLPSSLTTRILTLVQKGEDPNSFFNFWTRLQKNPSYRSVKQLWSFLSHQGIPITPDGCFLAYKSVKKNFRDHHSGRFSNSPGVVQEMARNKISDDPTVACHEGFHVGTLSYAKNFNSDNSRVVICKIDPKDVVCVPFDASSQKMRVCRYEVIGNHGSAILSSDSSSSFSPKRVVQAKWEKYDKMDITELISVPLDILRSYASNALNIVGSSKIPGGKTALIQVISQTRMDNMVEKAD